MRRKALLEAEQWSAPLIAKKADQSRQTKTEPEKMSHQRFGPKYGRSELKNISIGRYLAVFITHVIHPGHLYVQIADRHLPLYYQMMEDLKQEFNKASNQSQSFCSSPVLGKCY